MAGWNFKPNAVVTSWVTGIATTPAEKSKCVRCRTAPATCWVSFLYRSGKKGRVVEGHRATCEACNEPYAAEMNTKAEAKAAKGPKAKTEKKGRTKKATAEKPADTKPTLTADEATIAAKYGIEVKPQSMRYDETRGKKVFTLYCAICKKAREIATQDAFQVRTCGEPECKKAHKKANG